MDRYNEGPKGLASVNEFLERRLRWQKISGLCVSESLVGEGNEVPHIDLIMGPRGSDGRDGIRKMPD